MLGQHSWKKNDYASAELYFERATKIDDIEAKALIEHARMLVSIRSFEKAIRLLEKAQEINPQPRVTRYLVSIRNILLSSKVRL
jgi:tetratricopeptide (TPR) repeat protein